MMARNAPLAITLPASKAEHLCQQGRLKELDPQRGGQLAGIGRRRKW
ncbi:hypothetical protein [Pantoea sp. JZ29]|nr:hypothetical protein [Pantoea sp. JZ29]